MTTIKLEIETCRDCPKCLKSRTENVGYAFDYDCSVNGNSIAKYVEYNNEAPKTVPEWCPLKI